MQRIDRAPKKPRLTGRDLSPAVGAACWDQKLREARNDGEKAELYFQRSLTRSRSTQEAALSDVRRALRLQPDEPKYLLQAVHSLHTCGHDSQARLALKHAQVALGTTASPDLREQLKRANRLFFAPFESVPPEILALILEASDLSPVVTSQVCSTWRQLVLSCGPLWRDTRFIGPPREDLLWVKEPREQLEQGTCSAVRRHACFQGQWQLRQRAVMIDRCASLSKDTLTHLKIGESCHRQEVAHWIEVADRSKATLTHLDCDLTRLCNCLQYARGGTTVDGQIIFPKLAESYDESILAATLMRLVRQCPELDSVTLALRRPSHELEDINALGGHVAFPKRVTIRTAEPKGPLYDRTHIKLAAFLDCLTSRTVSFSLVEDGNLWLSDWTWKYFQSNASRLETLALYTPLGAQLFLTLIPFAGSAFTNLRQLTLVQQEPPHIRYADGITFRMPRLRSACVEASLAVKLDAPHMRSLTLVMRKSFPPRDIAAMLQSFPELESLSMALCYHEDQDHVHQLLDALEPIKHGTIICPKLRHLGIASVDDPSLVFPEWAAELRGKQDIETTEKRHSIDESYEEYLIRPAVGAAAIRVEQQRRRISSGLHPLPSSTGKTAEASGSAFRRGAPSSRSKIQSAPVLALSSAQQWGTCCALETIRLSGLRVELEVWQALLRSSEASVQCQPDPVKSNQLRSGDSRKGKGRKIFVP